MGPGAVVGKRHGLQHSDFYKDCFDNTEAFCLFFTFLFCCAELRLTNMWLLVSEGMLKPLFSQQLATNLELPRLLFWNLEL